MSEVIEVKGQWYSGTVVFNETRNAYCWAHDGDTVIYLSDCKSYGVDKLPRYNARQQGRARDLFTDERLSFHRAEAERFKRAEPALWAEMQAERRAEARAAFGPGEQVVNVITGERYTT